MNQLPKDGPTPPHGKAIASKNALKHGLLSQEVLMDHEEADSLVLLSESITESLNPVGTMETLMVDRIITNVWRLRRAIFVETQTMDWYTHEKLLDFDNTPEEQMDRRYTKKILSNDSVEKILRYETTIERGIFKALHELERMQAVRNGREVALPSMVDMSLDSSFGKNNHC